ncbi:TetR/AcrR family transcriptional regulator [Agromyces sp. MMS24-JH15]|uniref:TetR/AcrR family transcriptional regulator n=1 Tax=Agromyces sp. MMS24-JH15 TaxID=3243765 RepID=UPI003749567D
MATRTATPTSRRTPLTRERVLQAALAIADHDGIPALTMRALAERLGVEAMSLYHHLPNKDAVLDGVIEAVFAEVEQEVGGFAAPDDVDAATWALALRGRILAARRVLLRHPWAPLLMNQRGAAGPNAMRHVDGLVGVMRAGGLSHDLIHHALHAFGSRLFGYVQELGDDSATPTPVALEQLAMIAPHLAAMLGDVVHDEPDTTLGWCDDQFEFEFGLDLLLEGLERRRRAEAGR